jgi:hypothetical protein
MAKTKNGDLQRGLQTKICDYIIIIIIRLRWLKSIDNNLKSQPQHVWKYISNFRKHRSGFIHLEVDGAHLVHKKQLLMLSRSTFVLFITAIVLWTFLIFLNLLNFYPLPPFPMRMSAKPSRD